MCHWDEGRAREERDTRVLTLWMWGWELRKLCASWFAAVGWDYHTTVPATCWSIPTRSDGKREHVKGSHACKLRQFAQWNGERCWASFKVQKMDIEAHRSQQMTDNRHPNLSNLKTIERAIHWAIKYHRESTDHDKNRRQDKLGEKEDRLKHENSTKQEIQGQANVKDTF
jgi:hypothetical protein